MKRMILGACVAAGFIGGHAVAMPNITVSYLQQTGTVAVDTPIELWVRVSSDGPVGNALGFPFGLAPRDLPKFGSWLDWSTLKDHQLEFASYTSVSVGPGYGCTPNCDVRGYTFSTYYGSRVPAFFGGSQDALRTGDFLLGTFVPDGTHATGNIVFPLVPFLSINIYGASADGKPLSANISPINGFEACSHANRATCSFTRNVVAVPEISSLSMALMGVGAFGLRQALRRRQARWV